MIGRYGKPARALAILLVAVACTTPVPPSISPTGNTSQAPGSTAQAPGSSTAPPAATGQPSGQAGLRLNEVRFAPAAGEPAFVEIANTSGGQLDVAATTLRLAGSDLPLANAPALAAGGLLLVLLDGLGSIEGATVHAPAGLTLPPDSGNVELIGADGTLLDHIAWGDGNPDAVATGPGGIVPDTYPQGSTIARAAGASTPGAPTEWFVSAAATAGNANPGPTVSVMLPVSGAILDPGAADLFWYPVPGASSYRIQVATEETFASPVLDTSVTEPQLSVASLAPGAYLWRVQAVAASGTAADFSEPADFELASGATAQARMAAFVAVDTPGKHLSVPLIGQHKDTAMLLLERNVETGAHPWDADHQTLDPNDPADNKNCALASIAMVSAFYGGGLSQDRIGYEVISHRARNLQGPEGDLMYGYGTDGQEALDVLKWALGDVTYPGFMTFEDMWNHVVREIEAGRPIVAANSHHAFVITGYEVTGGRRLISINDPWPGRTYKQDIDHVRIPASDFNFFLMPAAPNVRHQEESVTTDSDGDGVVDFDETVRFGTNASSDDGDQDLLRDKQDIVTGVFDPQYGYATTQSEAGRDFDSDGTPTERDKDSDSGGCPDGVEDMNGNGHLDAGERSNFNVDDDRRVECESDDVTLHGTFSGHDETSPLSTSDATFDVIVIWHNPRNFMEPLGFEIQSANFTFETTIFGVCATSGSEGGALEMYKDDVQHFVYGDFDGEQRRTASAQILDMRADGGGVHFALTASKTFPSNGDPSCDPPFEPFGDVPICPLVFEVVPPATQDGRPTLTSSDDCEVSGTTWTGHLVEQ